MPSKNRSPLSPLIEMRPMFHGSRKYRRSKPQPLSFVLAGGKTAVFALCLLALLSHPGSLGAAGAYSYRFPGQGILLDGTARTVIGIPQIHKVSDEETLLDIARQYGLGFNELADLYPHQDPWLLRHGMEVTIPSQWILPAHRNTGIVINIAELRLYYFMDRIGMVKTFPIGIGDEGWETPLGDYQIGEKRVRPTWHVPQSLQEKYGTATVAPGPDNPLGNYWMRLGHSAYGIHGTNFPWSVGRLVTHGCIRLYPEHIQELFQLIQPGTPVQLIYEPVKLGYHSGKIYAEVHRDIYTKVEHFVIYGHDRLAATGLGNRVDWKKFQQALQRQDGLPVDITRR
jgi:L,D-transpeptidase ErfK/SrfK